MRPVHFEIHAEDPQRCIKFYKAVFGWEVKKFPTGDFDYWLVTTGKDSKMGINGAILKRMGPNPDAKANIPVVGYVLTIGTSNIDAIIKKIEAAGGTVALPKDKVEGVGLIAQYKDTESNIFGVIEPDMQAMAASRK